MSTHAAGAAPIVAPAPARPVLAGWALGLALEGPVVLLLVGVLSTGLQGQVPALIAGIGLLLAPPSVLAALVLGLVALSRAAGGGRGRGLAVAAVVLSAMQIALVVLTLVGTFLLFVTAGS